MAKASQQLAVVHTNLQKLLQAKASALPKNFNQTRFLQNTMAVLQDTKEIEKCDPVSVARTMLKGAFLGLDFHNKECYAIPYGNSLNFQTDYKGEKKIAKLYSIKPINDIYAKVVRAGDIFEEHIENGIATLSFNPKPFNTAKIIGVFAVCQYKDGTILYETMTIEEVEQVRTSYSKVPNGKAWKNSYGEMVKKTCIRRLCKGIEIEFESLEQKQAWDDGADAEFEEVPYAEPIEMPKPKVQPKEKVSEEIPFPEPEAEVSGSADAQPPN